MNVKETPARRKADAIYWRDKEARAEKEVADQLYSEEKVRKLEEYLKNSLPVFKMFEAGYAEHFGDILPEIFARLQKTPLATQTLIKRLGDELEKIGIPPTTWLTLATRRFLKP